MLFVATINQVAVLCSFILIGYLLVKLNRVPEKTENVLSKLENDVFLPALILNTFLHSFTVEKLAGAWRLLLGSLALELLVIPLSFLCVRFCTKDAYTRKIYLYGLCFSNFGFMGNAVVSTLFGEVFVEYTVFVLVLWTLIYLWGVPSLLTGDGGSIRSSLKKFANPMFISMLIGMVAGLAGISAPAFIETLLTGAGSCMTPVAMLLTGMTVARVDVRSVLKIKSIYLVSLLRLLVFPLLFIAVLPFVGELFSRTFIICAVCSLAMPLGLNTVVVPSALGKDTTVASGMALISHVCSCVSIPLIFSLLSRFIS